MKLYEIELKGMTGGFGSDVQRGLPYVVANDPEEAYQKVRTFLNEEDLGHPFERELFRITLLAETGDYPLCRRQLFL
jgi:hypothetical protein